MPLTQLTRTMTSKPETSKTATPDFEAALQQLQAVVSRMENEQQSLDASIADYEKGSELAALCQRYLDSAQLKVEQLLKSRDGHHFETLESQNGASDDR